MRELLYLGGGLWAGWATVSSTEPPKASNPDSSEDVVTSSRGGLLGEGLGAEGLGGGTGQNPLTMRRLMRRLLLAGEIFFKSQRRWQRFG